MPTLKIQINCEKEMCGECEHASEDGEDLPICDIFGPLKWVAAREENPKPIRCPQCLAAQEEGE